MRICAAPATGESVYWEEGDSSEFRLLYHQKASYDRPITLAGLRFSLKLDHLLAGSEQYRPRRVNTLVIFEKAESHESTKLSPDPDRNGADCLRQRQIRT